MYSTRYRDTDLALYYYGYRYFSTNLGRWVCRDPIDERDSRNLHAFVHNSPILNIDPLGLKVWLEVSPISFGTVHCALVIETCENNVIYRVTYEIGPGPNIGPHPGEERGISTRTKLFGSGLSGSSVGSSSGSSSGSGCSVCASSAGSSSGSSALSAVYPGPKKSEGDRNVTRRKHLYVVDPTYDNDDKYIEMAEKEPLGVYDLFGNNCCDWARRVINGAGGDWPLAHSLNYWFTEANPNKTLEDEIDEVDLYSSVPETPQNPSLPQ